MIHHWMLLGNNKWDFVTTRSEEMVHTSETNGKYFFIFKNFRLYRNFSLSFTPCISVPVCNNFYVGYLYRPVYCPDLCNHLNHFKKKKKNTNTTPRISVEHLLECKYFFYDLQELNSSYTFPRLGQMTPFRSWDTSLQTSLCRKRGGYVYAVMATANGKTGITLSGVTVDKADVTSMEVRGWNKEWHCGFCYKVFSWHSLNKEVN